jgi:hypothetical protein
LTGNRNRVEKEKREKEIGWKEKHGIIKKAA